MVYKGNLENLHKDVNLFLTDKLFTKKEKLLTKKLIHFFKKQAPLLIENSELLKVISFEFDSILSFSYEVYPEPSVIPQSHWENQFTIDCSRRRDYNTLQLLEKKFNLEEWEDVFVSKENEDYYVDVNEILSELNYMFFQNAWKKAKEKCNVAYRGFLFWHDVYVGIDLDTGKSAKDEDVISILNNEQFDFNILKEKEPKTLEYFKNNQGLISYATLSLSSFSEFRYIRPSDKVQLVNFESYDFDSLETKKNMLIYLIDNEKTFFDSFCRGIMNDFLLKVSNDSNLSHDKIKNLDDIKKNILIREIIVQDKNIDGFSLISISGSCSWDEENGFGVIMHKDSVIEVGVWINKFD